MRQFKNPKNILATEIMKLDAVLALRRVDKDQTMKWINAYYSTFIDLFQQAFPLQLNVEIILFEENEKYNLILLLDKRKSVAFFDLISQSAKGGK